MKTTYMMEMAKVEDFRPSERSGDDLEVRRVGEPYGELAKFLHTLVGHPWRWGGRNEWGKGKWDAYVSQTGFEMWLGLHEGTPAGYAELIRHESGDVEITTMGVAPQFIGKGLGGPLLSAVVKRAWELTTTKVRLSTCSHDHPRAKANYEARGFKVAAVREAKTDNPAIPSFWELVEAGS